MMYPSGATINPEPLPAGASGPCELPVDRPERCATSIFTTAGLTDSAAPITAREYASNRWSSDESPENGWLLLNASPSAANFESTNLKEEAIIDTPRE